MGIPVGKLALYTLCAGIDPSRTLPIMIDVGTNNPDLLKDPLYLGWRHPRISQSDYDPFMDQVVAAIKHRWPNVVLQWEDFAKANAQRFLHRYQDQLATFNDDIQGTAAVALAGLWRAARITGRPLVEHKIVISGAGSAATGLGELMQCLNRRRTPAERITESPVWLVDTRGLVHEGRQDLSSEKKPFVQRIAAVRAAGLDPTRPIDLHAVVNAIHPGVLLGLSGQPGIFDEALVRSMAAAVERPIIFPLSNPTSRCEATLPPRETPADLIKWTDGRALVATGSPFDPVTWKGKTLAIGQCNNAFIFPGLGLGLMVSSAQRIPNELFLTAAECLAAFDLRLPGYADSLFPNLENVRMLSEQIACAIAREVLQKGLSHTLIPIEDISQSVKAAMWEPVYPQIKPL